MTTPPETWLAICKTKYRYLRHLDLKEFDDLAECLTPTCTAAYQDGELNYDGRDAIVGFLKESLSDPQMITRHEVVHPEITLTSPTTANATWYLEDRVVVQAVDFEITGTAIYEDRFEKDADGTWRLAHTGYKRIYEEHRTHSTGALLKFTSRFE